MRLSVVNKGAIDMTTETITLRVNVDQLSALRVLLNNKHNRQVEIPNGMSLNLDDLHAEVTRKLNEVDNPLGDAERHNMLCTIVGHLAMGNSVFDLIEMLIPADEILERYMGIVADLNQVRKDQPGEWETTVEEELADCFGTGKQYYRDSGSIIEG
ncbi:hypothetical protein [Rhizobium phage RHph_X3_2]|nr:hypothetical protein [Rhizobium phage RHph_X3_2]